MNGEITLYNTIKAASAVTALLTSISSKPAIAIGVKEPTKWKPSYTTISIYNAVGVDDRNNALVTDLTINCRAPKEDAAKTLASAVVDAVNRVSVPVNDGQFYTFTGGVIPPEDENDSYNLPITATIKAVKELA